MAYQSINPSTGQCCVAAKRFIVVEALVDRFLELLGAALAKLVPGDRMDPATTLAPLSTEQALVGLVKQVNQAVAHGATLVMGGHRIKRPGAFMEATILAGVPGRVLRPRRAVLPGGGRG